MSRVVVDIGRIVVHGAAPADPVAFRRAVEREIARHVAVTAAGAVDAGARPGGRLDIATAAPVPVGRAIASLVTRRLG